MNRISQAILASTLLFSGTAIAADNAANKAGVVGLGADATLGGTQGLQVRYGVNPALGLQLTLGYASTNNSEDDGDSGVTSSDLGVGVGGTYKIIKAKTASLSGLASLDYHSNKAGAYSTADEDGSGLKTTDMAFGLGLQGEVFLAKKFSLHSKVGLTINPYGTECDEYGDNAECAGDPDYSGTDISLGGGLIGSAGFTVWFK
ncbi:MAG: hypothetical protein ACPGTU_02125 [Myxococcota bacterium]